MIALYSLTIFTSAMLLFMVQPMIGEMVLPLLGGSASVWVTATLFFQIVLLAGYLYSHIISKILAIKWQAILHVALLVVAYLTLPIGPYTGLTAPSGSDPTIWQLVLLATTAGLPFFSLSANSPLLQYWFSRTGHKRSKNPYFLFAASNIGSMLALLTYPSLIEPNFSVSLQEKIWDGFFAFFILLMSGAAYLVTQESTVASNKIVKEKSLPPTWRERLLWVMLAMIPSSLMLSVTTVISTSITPMPLFWVVSLALYLLTFILAFSERNKITSEKASYWFMISLIFGIFVGILSPSFSADGYFGGYFTQWSAIIFHLTIFFFASLSLHIRVSELKPSARYLTEFFVWISVGGCLGGLINTLMPLLVNDLYEYAVGLLFALILQPYFLNGLRKISVDDASVFIIVFCCLISFNHAGFIEWIPEELFFFFYKESFASLMILGLLIFCWISFYHNPLQLNLSLLAAVFAIFLLPLMSLDRDDVLFKERTFYGLFKVRQDTSERGPIHHLSNGMILHGSQYRDPTMLNVTTTYYTIDGGLGRLTQHASASLSHQSVAAIGLGTGTLSCLFDKTVSIDFYEIDPAVQMIATNPDYFSFYDICPPKKQIIIGDARQKIAEAPDHSYQMIVADAFSGDAIPSHLVTKEAMQLYLTKLKPDGFIAFHVANKFLDLLPIMSALEKEFDMPAVFQQSYVVFSPNPEKIKQLKDAPHQLQPLWEWVNDKYPEGTLWTDDFNSILPLIMGLNNDKSEDKKESDADSPQKEVNNEVPTQQ